MESHPFAPQKDSANPSNPPDRSPKQKPSPNWYLLIWLLLVWHNIAFFYLAAIFVIIVALDLQSGGHPVYVLYPSQIESAVAIATDIIGLVTAITSGVLLVMLFFMLAEWQPDYTKTRRIFTTLSVLIPIWGLFHLRRIGDPQGKLQFSLRTLMGAVTACAVLLSLIITVTKALGLRGLIQCFFILEFLLLFLVIPYYLLLRWRQRHE